MTAVLLTAIAVLLRVISNPVGNVFQKQLTASGHHPLAVSCFTYAGLSLLCAGLLPFLHVPSLSPSFWIYSVLGGIAGALGNGFLVKALQEGDLSVLGPVNSYKSVVGIIVGIFLLGELPSLWGLAGTALIIWGSYFVLETTNERFSWGLLKSRSIRYRLWALVLTAIEAVLVKKVILASSVTLAFVSWCWTGAFFSLLLLLLYRVSPVAEARSIKGRDAGRYGLLIGCIGLMQFTTNYVFDHMPVGYALALFQLSVLVSVVLGYRIFRETHLRQKLIGSLIMIGGSVLIILTKEV